jgi:hypothetical protein
MFFEWKYEEINKLRNLPLGGSSFESLVGHLVAAARILESVDRDSDPCEDFYQFACGGWISQHPVPESQSSWDQFRVLRGQLLVQLRGAW